MKTHMSAKPVLVITALVTVALLIAAIPPLAAANDRKPPAPNPDPIPAPTPEPIPAHIEGGTGPLTGVWWGTFINQQGSVSRGYLNVTENADGTLSGQWGNAPKGCLTIEQGERVTEGTYQWEAPSQANEQGRYRVRAEMKENMLQLTITYTWREDGRVKGLTATSALARS